MSSSENTFPRSGFLPRVPGEENALSFVVAETQITSKIRLSIISRFSDHVALVMEA
jgi:hypothetical protein